MANFASNGLQPDKERNSNYSSTQLRLKPDDVSDHGTITRHGLCSLNQDQRLLAAEAEVEEKFQCEKADIIAEMESNFQSEKWDLVAEAMSLTGSVRFSAELIQTQYERLTRNPQKSDAQEEENHDTIDLPRRTSRTNRRRADKASNVTQQKHTRLFLYQKRPDSKSQASKSTSGQKSSKVGKDKSQFRAEQSARSRRVWAKRRALGMNGRDGGPPKAKKAKMAVPKAAPKAEIPPNVLPKQNAPRVIEEEGRGDVNQHRHSLAQIIPAASQTGSEQKRIKPYKKVRTY